MKLIKIMRLACFCLPIFLIQSVTAEDLGKMLSGYTPGGTGYDSAWSVFVGGDFTVNASFLRARGRIFVRNNMHLSGTYELGRVVGSNASPPDDSEVLVIGNDLLGSGRFNVGAVEVGYRVRVENTYSPDIAFGWSGALPPLAGGVDNASADLLIADLQQKSAYWGSLSPTPGGSISKDPWHVYITADGISGNPKLWIFNLDHDIPTTSTVEFSGFEPGDTILINVNKAGASDTVSISPSSFQVNSEFSSLIESQLLWNFPDATTVQLAALSALPGAVLIADPGSTTTMSINSGHKGRFATCGNLVQTNGAFENYPFDGNLPDLPAAILITEIAELPSQMISELPLPQMISVVFNSESGQSYQVMTCGALGEPWSPESVMYPIEEGFSELSDLPFIARAGDSTEVLIPRSGRVKAFFKIIEAR